MLTRGEEVLAVIGGVAVLTAEAKRTHGAKAPKWFEEKIRSRLATNTLKATEDAISEAASAASRSYLQSLRRV